MFIKDPNVTVLCDLPASPRFGARKLVLIEMDCIEPWGKNPAQRTTVLNLKELGVRLTGDFGQLLPGSVVNCGKADGQYHYRLVDGHRRHALMSVAGFEQFLAILYMDVQSGTDKFGLLFETINSATRAVNLRERVWLALMGEPVAAGKTAARIAEEIRRNLSKAAMRVFMENFCPTFAFDLAKKAYNELAPLGMVDAADRKEFLSDCLIWQEDLNQQGDLKQYLDEVSVTPKTKIKKKMLEVLQECISRKQKFPAGAVKGKRADDDDDDDEEEATTTEDGEESNIDPLVRRKVA